MKRDPARNRRTPGRAAARVGLACALLVACSHAAADQGGVPFWFSGQFASLAAVPGTPGWSVALLPYYYNGSADASDTFQTGDKVSVGLKAVAPLVIAQLGYASRQKVLGGQPYVALGWGGGGNRTAVDLTISRVDAFDRADSSYGGTDLYPYASLTWNRGNDNWMAYVTGDVPVGAYDSARLANLGIGHAALDAGGGYTYLNGQTGVEFSAVGGLTYNWENTSTAYRNGIDAHVDWAMSRLLPAQWQVGVVGYIYTQLTGDGGSGNRVGPIKSGVASVGPQLGYLLTLGGRPAYLNVRGYKEFWAQNRVEGYALFATISLPLGGVPK